MPNPRAEQEDNAGKPEPKGRLDLFRALNADLDIKHSRTSLRTLGPSLAMALKQKLETQQRQRNAEESRKQRELTLVALGIEGKNEKEREANLAGVKARDETYKELTTLCDQAGAALIDAEVALEGLTREWTALAINQRQATAIIELLAGDKSEGG